MLEVILISWAALGLTMPFAKAVGVADRTVARRRQGRKTTLSDVVDDVQYMQQAECAAYSQVARDLCGGEHASEPLVKAATVTMRGLTSCATPNIIDLVDSVAADEPR